MSVGANPSFHSKFGGMWIDRSDFAEQLRDRVRDGRVPGYLESPIQQLANDGFVIFEGAASDDDLSRFNEAISKAFREGHESLISQVPGSSAPKRVIAGMERRRARIVDAFAVLPEALDLLSSPRLVEFMTAVFDERPSLFQSLSFDMGSEQGFHQDTAYVVVDRPMEMLACWIALEDVSPGSGELQYMVGSHRLPDFDFGDSKKHWDAVKDGSERHTEWARWILDQGALRGFSVQKFMAKRGDILIWHADLAHGGSPITNPHLTRKSLVGHYCPDSAVPHYVKLSPERAAKCTYRGMSYCSGHYDLAMLTQQTEGTP